MNNYPTRFQYSICINFYNTFYRLTALLFINFYYATYEINAQHNDYNAFVLNADNGLSQNSVWDGFIDKEGYLWIGTADGLNRWDGNNIKYYYNSSKYGGLVGNSAFSFFVDSKSNFWVLNNRGISIYNNVKDCFEHVLDLKFIPCLLGEYNHKLFVITSQNTISAIDILTKKVAFTLNIKGENLYNSVAESNKAVVIGNYSLVNFNKNQILIFNLKTYQYSFINHHFYLSRGIKLNEEEVLFTNINTTYKFKLKKDKVVLERFVNKNNSVEDVMCGSMWQNKLMLATINGIFFYTPNNIELINEFRIKNFSLQNNLIDKIFTDKQQNLYICSNISGLFIISKARNKFKHYKTNQAKTNMIKAINITPDGKIITGQFGSDIVVYDKNGNYKEIKFKFNKLNAIWGICNINNYKILAIGYNKLYVFNHHKNIIEKTILFSKETENQYPVFYDIKDYILLNLNSNGNGKIYRFNKKLETIEELISFDKKLITTFYPMSNNAYFIGTMEGLWIKKDALSYPVKIIDDWIKHISKNKNNVFLISTINGLYFIKQNGTIIKKYSIDNGLKSNFIYAAFTDSFNQIWLSTNKGLGLIKPDNNIKRYSLSDGLQSNEFNTGAFAVDSIGNLYFGGVNGFNIIKPELEREKDFGTNTVITKMMVNDEVFETDSAINTKKSIVLNYNQNTLSFEFSCLDFSNHFNNKYRYFIKGIEPNWINLDNKHFIRYAKLQPGTYTLMLQSAGDNGIWGKIKSLNIIILPPFWLTWWFKLLIILNVVFLFVYIFYAFKRNIQQKTRIEIETQQKLEAERIRISRDLHDNVGSQISFLISNLDWLIENYTEKNKVKEKILSIKESGKAAIQTLRETIWAINHSKLSFEELTDRIKQYTLKVIDIEKKIKVQFNEDIIHNLELSPMVALNIFRVCQEAVHNAIKHSNCTLIKINFSTSTSKINIEISDNGCGFAHHESIKKGHYGMENMKARIAECKGLINILPNNPGTKIEICINI